jgi:aspartyl-tRNA(Asn)/glutamyl-tRNA(Gln) amidotransferase subunit B
LGTRREIKNLNSFKFMQQAIDYEVRWQIDQIEDGHAIEQATVLFDPDTGETRAMRTKEDAADYRYFPDPDLPPLVIGRDWVERVRSEMAELPRVMAERFVTQYALPEYDANLLTQSIGIAKSFEKSVAASNQPKMTANWFINAFIPAMSNGPFAAKLIQEDSPIKLANLIKRIADGTISNNSAKQVFEVMWEDGSEVDAIIEAKGLKQINDTGALEAIIDEVLAANPKNVEEFKAGNAKALNGLVGPIMKASKGKANPAQVNELLMKKLS